ncbi:hypothetical protein FE257_009113 [Aspergillus nanangensis]|uniref:FAD-binding PCMH-type domain-containing protein n=1 Tax=Aspergillus nanangensis TaxID=2582783 RepID=A0AAD4CWR0_ASPNN|nr:hypothetical protein FE257_009113 [Aspergillus nanangensis]
MEFFSFLILYALIWVYPVRVVAALGQVLLCQGVSSGHEELHDNDIETPCQRMCRALATILPGTVIDVNEEAYAEKQMDYFSRQQSDLYPACFFLPRNASEVSQAIILANATACAFAVKSGGHATFEGASNSRQGLTINLERLNQVTLAENGTVAKIGAGNRWHDVFVELEKNNITVPGGRTGSVGVGGLTLGGGLSFFSGHIGLAVLADGSILDVNRESHPDLYWALRGGGANFALITRFDMHSFPHEMMWGGIRNYTIDQVDAVLDAYVDFGLRAAEDPSAYQITTIYYTNAKHHATVDLYNTVPEPNPSIFSALERARAYSDTTAVNRQSNITWTNYRGQPDGHRQTYWTATYRLDRGLADFVKQVFLEETDQLGDLEGLEARCILQVFTTDILRHMKKNGGNALGISDRDYPLMLLNPAFRWEDQMDDSRIMLANMNFVNRVDAQARKMGLYEPFLYMNYASQFQDVVHGYGEANLERLRAVALDYDPDGLFQTLQPGYFKLNGRVGW